MKQPSLELELCLPIQLFIPIPTTLHAYLLGYKDKENGISRLPLLNQAVG